MPIDKNGNEIPQSTHNLVGYRESLQLFYSPNHELIKSITIKDEGLKVVKTVTHYYYDAFGRRIGKSSSTQKSSKLNQRGELVRFPSNLSSLNTTDRPQRKNTLMLWDGNRQIQEITDDFTFTTIYEQNSFVPVARIVERQPHLLEQAKRDEQAEWAKYENMQLTKRSKANIHHKAHTGLRIYHYHTDHLGTPQELTNDRGEVVWLNYQMAWGGSFSQLNNVHNLDGLDISADELQPFRFQGQFYDGETGLHYNRFRYYDSDVGMFIQRDPIGLLGGSNVFQYAPNPVMWIDPFGLACLTYNHKLKPNKKTNKTELRRQIRGQISAMNKIIQEEGMIGLKNRIRNYSTSLEKEGRAYTASLGSAGKNKAWLHEPDMRVGGLPTDVYKTGDKRVNSILGGQAKERAEDILAMPDDTTKITYRLKVN